MPEIAFNVQDSGAKVLFFEGNLADRIPGRRHSADPDPQDRGGRCGSGIGTVRCPAGAGRASHYGRTSSKRRRR